MTSSPPVRGPEFIQLLTPEGERVDDPAFRFDHDDAEIAAKNDPEPEPGPKRIAVVFAHPDDAEFGVAGSVARWVKEGHTVIYVSLTSGDQGGEDPSVDPKELAKIREAEQLAASEILGVSETIFLRIPDGSVTADLETRAKLVKIFRTIKPVPYPGRAPHVHYKIRRNGKDLLTTQCYIQGHAGNDRDGVYRGIRDPKAKESVTIPFTPIDGSKTGELAARFDIILGLTPEA